jgi:hypothetical protein
MTENNFLIALTNSFKAFLETGSRSNEKLKKFTWGKYDLDGNYYFKLLSAI